MKARVLVGVLVLVACRERVAPPPPATPYTYPYRYTYPGSPPPTPQVPPAAAPAARPAPAEPRPSPPAPLAVARPHSGLNHAQDVRPASGPFQAGEASFYHDNLAGNPTASGAPYDPSKLTAAHRKLPFGTVVDVVRTDGRWVRVTINDRGPYHGGRIIDLSRRAAEELGLMKRGVAPVKLYVVSRPQR